MQLKRTSLKDLSSINPLPERRRRDLIQNTILHLAGKSTEYCQLHIRALKSLNSNDPATLEKLNNLLEITNASSMHG